MEKFEVRIEKINYIAVETSSKNLKISQKSLTRLTSVCNSGPHSLAIILWVGAVSIPVKVRWCSAAGSKGRYGLCLVAGKTVWPLVNVCHMWALYDRWSMNKAVLQMQFTLLVWNSCIKTPHKHETSTQILGWKKHEKVTSKLKWNILWTLLVAGKANSSVL